MKMPVVSRAPIAASPRGVAYFVVALLLFGGMDAIAKFLVETLSPVQVVWGRYVFHLIFVALLFATGRFGRLGGTARLPLQVTRSLLLLGATVSFFFMLSYLPLADSVAITYVAPIFLTLLAALVLKERIGPRRWAAVAVGFVGALIIIRPGLGALHWAASLGLVTALCFALYEIATRVLSGRDSPYTTVFYTALVGALVTSVAAPFFWSWPSPLGWGLLVLLGLLGGLSHFLLIKAFDHAPASGLAPYGYLDLIWAALLGLVLFDQFPDAWTLVGAAVVAASGLYIFYRENLRRRP